MDLAINAGIVGRPLSLPISASRFNGSPDRVNIDDGETPWATMTGRKGVKPRNIIALIAVVAFHVTIIAILLASKAGRSWTFETKPIELMFLPPAPPKSPLAQVLPNSIRRQVEAFKLAPPSSISPFTPVVPTESPQAPIDWADEAAEVAKDESGAREFRSLDRHQRTRTGASSKSPFADAPAHHAYEQFRTDDGRWGVFVSDDCYQISDPLASPGALGNGLGAQTYCIGKSHEPRGDLFDQLPAYQKYHPN